MAALQRRPAGGLRARGAQRTRGGRSRTARAEGDLRLEIARAYWTLVAADEQLRVVDESLARTHAHLSDVRNQLDAGLIPPNDVLAVEAQQSRQELLTIQARANRDVAEAELGRLTGIARARIEPISALALPADGAADADRPTRS